MFNKIKKIYQESTFLFGDKSIYSVNYLMRTMLNNPTKPEEKIFSQARLNYLTTYKNSKYIKHEESIMLSNLGVKTFKTTVRELPHLIYHTLDQKSQLIVIPDENIFNTKKEKYGDFTIKNTGISIEAKTLMSL